MFTINPKSIKYLETSRGVAFTAELLEDGKPVGMVENTGCGGATFPTITDGWGSDIMKRLEAASKDDGGTEWYLERLMDEAEGVTEQDKEDLSEVFKLGQYIKDNLK